MVPHTKEASTKVAVPRLVRIPFKVAEWVETSVAALVLTEGGTALSIGSAAEPVAESASNKETATSIPRTWNILRIVTLLNARRNFVTPSLP